MHAFQVELATIARARSALASLRTGILLCALWALAPARAIADNGWQSLPGAPIAGRLDDMHFVDETTGWVVSSSGEIHRTTDGGSSWQLQLSTGLYFRTIYFADAQNGVAGTLGSQLLYRTTDAGANWIAVPNESIPLPRPAAVCGLAGVGDYIYGTGAYFGPAVLIRSSDRGATWTSVDMSPYARNLVDCYFVTPTSGFAVGGSPGSPGQSKPVILFTADGGQTWQTRYLGGANGAYCWKIYFADATTGYVSVYDLSGATVLRTKDGGLSFSPVQVPGVTSLEGIGFVTPRRGWVDGWGGSSGTTDGGVTWQLENLAGGNSFINRFQFFGVSKGFAVGYTVFRYDATTSDAPLAAAAPPRESVLFQLASSPNPFQDRAVIRFTLRSSERTQVRIYDSLGREMRTLLDRALPAGTHSVEWDGRDANGQSVASGVYLYRVDAGGRAESRAMTLVQ